MPIFTWNNSFSINIEVIDRQHQQWLNLANRIYELSINRDIFESLNENLMNLELLVYEAVEYIAFHLRYEEGMLKKVSYPQDLFNDHKEKHSYFESQMNIIKKEIQNIITIAKDRNHHLIIEEKLSENEACKVVSQELKEEFTFYFKKLTQFCINWLIEHIKQEDKRYASHVIAKLEKGVKI